MQFFAELLKRGCSGGANAELGVFVFAYRLGGRYVYMRLMMAMVGANLEVMASDAKKMRGERPFVMCNLKALDGLDVVVKFIEKKGLLKA